MNPEVLFSSEAIIIILTALIGGIFLFLVVNKDFTLGIYAWFLATLFYMNEAGQGLKLAGSSLPSISLGRFLFVLLAFLFALGAFFRRHKLFKWTLLEYSMLLFVLLALISMFRADTSDFKIIALFTGYIFPFSMFYMSQSIYDNREKIEGLIKFMIIVGIYLSFTSICEHFSIASLVFPKYIMNPGIGIHFGRARGPFAQAAVNGTMLGFALSSSFYFLLNPVRKNLWIACSLVLLALLPLAILFTYTRAAWMGGLLVFIMVLFFAIKERKITYIIILVILCLAGVIVAPFILTEDTVVTAFERLYEYSPVRDRFYLYTISFNMFLDHPFFGIGFNRFSSAQQAYYKDVDSAWFRYVGLDSHNTFTTILAEVGITGALLILFIYLSILSRSMKVYKRVREARGLVVMFWGYAIVYIVNSMFIEMRYAEIVNTLFFILAGAICRMEK